MNIITIDEWVAEAKKRHGENARHWKFKCPSCGHVQSIDDFINAGIENPNSKVYNECIGRYIQGTGCNWSLYGLLHIHETEVIDEKGNNRFVFEFA